MTALKEPFFKAESAYFTVKGVKNRDFFRAAVHRDHINLLEEIERAAGLR
jgi:protein-arginine kinase activator protein McsA